ncbi:hypothetical protein PVK06_039120 [Gossypium arboreum]|uniref:Reverse transcriptase Ty1/copia-type domain-containing protein n=1 Tax=Gossypium arboreum TaxID=29729 RepID=A0ABR0N233_GOSAR|nr:hypothetical protein PVK06_039120 [Gossypium arboreum]
MNTIQPSQHVSIYFSLVQSTVSYPAATIKRPTIFSPSPPHCSFTQSTLGGSSSELGYACEESRLSVSTDAGCLSTPSLVSLALPSVPLGNTHTMVTRSKAKIFKPKALTVEAINYEPCTVEEALANLEWKLAVQAEFDALMANSTWEIDMRDLHYFLGIEVTRTATGSLHLCQRKYIRDLLDRSSLTNAESVHTPIISSSELSKDEGDHLVDPTEYQSLAAHLVALKRILRYLRGTIDHGLIFCPSERLTLVGYANANWGLDIDDHRSTVGYCVYFGDMPISWCSKKQQVVSRSTAVAEYRSLAAATSDITWLVSLLTELQIPSADSPTVWCDNSSAVAVVANPVLHYKFKHVELDLFFIREKVVEGSLIVSEVSACNQVANIFMKPLSVSLFTRFRSLV